jgi:hypothetical protein
VAPKLTCSSCCHRLSAKGFDIAAFCLTDLGAGAGPLQRAGIRVASTPRIGTTGKRSVLAPLRLVGGAATLLGLIRRWNPSVVHFFLPGPYLVGAPIAIAAGVPIKIMSRRSLSDYQEKRPGAARIERLLHQRMDLMLGNSRAVIGELAFA